MDNNNNASSTNTILIVVILLILVGFGVWWFTARSQVETTQETRSGVNVDVNLPGADTSGSPTPSPSY